MQAIYIKMSFGKGKKMSKPKISKEVKSGFLFTILGGGIWGILIVFSGYRLLSSCLMMLLAVGLYFGFAFVADGGNVLSLKALFSVSWIGSIGLANLKLLPYQKVWERKTWIAVFLAFWGFLLGMLFSEIWQENHKKTRLDDKLFAIKKHFYVEEKRLFGICMITGVIGIVSFVANIVYKGFLPFFSKDTQAYFNFCTKFTIVYVATSAIAGLCYYVLRKGKLRRWQKVLLTCVLIVEAFLIPWLSVSRGNQMIALLILMIPVVLLSKRRFIALVLSLLVAFGSYEVGTMGRHLSDKYLDEVFLRSGEENPGEEMGLAQRNEPEEADGNRIPSRVAFLYSYLISSHENMNEAVLNTTGYSHGLRQLEPVLTVIRIPALREKLGKLPFYRVKYELTTGDLITTFYYDFGCLGCFWGVFVWALLFGHIERNVKKNPNPFGMLLLGVCMMPTVLSFFKNWMDYFTFWMMGGTVLVLWFAVCYHKREKIAK